jgi:hypothetical protein
MEGTAFVQPIAGHTDISSYLIVRDTEDHWFLWLGNDDNGLTEIPEATAEWMRCRPEIEDIPLPRFWFDASSLPLSDSPKPSRSI